MVLRHIFFVLESTLSVLELKLKEHCLTGKLQRRKRYGKLCVLKLLLSMTHNPFAHIFLYQ